MAAAVAWPRSSSGLALKLPSVNIFTTSQLEVSLWKLYFCFVFMKCCTVVVVCGT